MLFKLYAIAANTFIETVRQPIFGILLWVAAGLLVLSPALAAFSLESGGDNKVMKDVCLATLLLYGLLASVFSATTVITREITDQTVLTVVSKPVSRPTFIVGKYLGVTAAMFVGYLFLAIVFFLVARHGVMETASDEYDRPVLVFGIAALVLSLVVATFGNYVYGWHFSSTLLACVLPLGGLALLAALNFNRKFGAQPFTTDFGDMQLVYATSMSFCGVLILTAFAVALSARFSQIITLILCAGIYLVGLLSDYYLGRPAMDNAAWIYSVLYAAVPNFQFFWAGNAITQELQIPLQQVLQVAAYAGLYSLGVLGLGVALFQTREVG